MPRWKDQPELAIRLYFAEKTPETGVSALRIEHVGRNRFAVAWKGKASYAMGIVKSLLIDLW